MLTDGGNRICSPELLAQIAEVIDSAILITRFGSLGQFDHRIIYSNPAFAKLTGYVSKEIIGRSPDVLCDPRTSGDKMLEFYSRCSQGGRFSVEMDSFRKLGGELKINLEVTPVIDETQGIHYYILMLKDKTEQKAESLTNNFFAPRHEAAQSQYVRPEPVMQQPFVQMQPEPVVAQQHNGYFEMPVSQFQQMMMQPEPQFDPQYEEVKKPESFERFWQSPNNDVTPHSSLNGHAAPGNNGFSSARDFMNAAFAKEPAPVVAHSNVEELPVKKVAAELSTDESIAEYCKTQFLANMSHDLRTPLNAIIGFSEVIKDQLFGPIENPRYVSYANDIFRSGQELFSTISEIMELSEIAPDEEVTDDERMNICDVIESVIDVLSPKAFEADVKIIKSFDARDLLLAGDRRKIKQAVAGVIGNSIKYSSNGSKIEITAATNEKGDFKLSVHAKSANILGQSALMGTVTRKMETEYPEISLAKRFVEAHDGKFGIFNSATAGTEISIILPAARLSMEPEKKTLLKVIS